VPSDRYWRYAYGGETIASVCALPGLPCTEPEAAQRGDFVLADDVSVSEARSDDDYRGAKRAGATSDPMEVWIDDASGRVLLDFRDVATFSILPGTRYVTTWRAEATTAETVHHLLLDQVLPRLLAHEGRLVLHAGGVRVEDRAVAFVGTTGAGKSTLIGSLRSAGHPLLSDDGIVVARAGDGVEAVATYPSLRLWPDAVAGVFPDGAPDLAPMAHYSTKQRVLVDGGTAAHPLPLAALYVLAQEPTDGRISIAPVSPRDACMEIVRNAFRLDPTDRERAAAQLAAAAAVADVLPAFSLAYPRAYERLPEVHATLHAHLATLPLGTGGVGS
jgi:hypothetical protein